MHCLCRPTASKQFSLKFTFLPSNFLWNKQKSPHFSKLLKRLISSKLLIALNHYRCTVTCDVQKSDGKKLKNVNTWGTCCYFSTACKERAHTASRMGTHWSIAHHTEDCPEVAQISFWSNLYLRNLLFLLTNTMTGILFPFSLSIFKGLIL